MFIEVQGRLRLADHWREIESRRERRRNVPALLRTFADDSANSVPPAVLHVDMDPLAVQLV